MYAVRAYSYLKVFKNVHDFKHVPEKSFRIEALLNLVYIHVILTSPCLRIGYGSEMA
jgi:hypothetical protein